MRKRYANWRLPAHKDIFQLCGLHTISLVPSSSVVCCADTMSNYSHLPCSVLIFSYNISLHFCSGCRAETCRVAGCTHSVTGVSPAVSWGSKSTPFVGLKLLLSWGQTYRSTLFAQSSASRKKHKHLVNV